MRLSEYTDYTLRVLMYCAARPGQLVTIGELAEHHGLSKNHLMKVVNDLARQGLLETTRGRGGGLRLLKDPRDIRVGDVVRASETDFRLVECFDAGTNLCTLTPSCRLKHLFGDALQAYFAALDGATLADVTAPVRTVPSAVRRGAVVAMPLRPAPPSSPARSSRMQRSSTTPARRLKATT
jgi:Rrf2 family transcriptional regulator, nitric oxide-sensitive transcriptional repressor